MVNYKVPRLVRFFEALPVNASNKVMKGGVNHALATGAAEAAPVVAVRCMS